MPATLHHTGDFNLWQPLEFLGCVLVLAGCKGNLKDIRWQLPESDGVMELVHLWTELELRLHELCKGTGAQSKLGLGFWEWPRPQPSLTDSASILLHPEAEEGRRELPRCRCLQRSTASLCQRTRDNREPVRLSTTSTAKVFFGMDWGEIAPQFGAKAGKFISRKVSCCCQ